MQTPVLGGGNRLTYAEIHATVLGLAVGLLASHALELGLTALAAASGALFVAIALGVGMRGAVPIAQRTVRREPWYALAAFLIAGAAAAVV